MFCTVEQLCEKEVVNIDTAEKVGWAADVELDPAAGTLISLCVCRKSGVFQTPPVFKIAWRDIVRIGKETILVRNVPCAPEKPKRRMPAPFGGPTSA